MKQPEFDPQVELIDESAQELLDIVIHRLLHEHGHQSDLYGGGLCLTYSSKVTEHSKLTDEFYESEQEVRVWTMEKSTGQYHKGSYVEIWTNLTPEEPMPGPGNGISAWHFQSIGLLAGGEFYETDEYQLLDENNRIFDTWLVSASQKSKKVQDYKKQRLSEAHAFQGMLEGYFTVADHGVILSTLARFDPANVIIQNKHLAD